MMQISTGPAAQLALDVRHAVRRFARTPTFALTALAVLALGIAANVTVFSMANAVLLQPLTFLEPERVVLFQTTSPARAINTASPVMFWHWRTQTEAIQDVAAFHPAVVNDTSGSNPVQVRASRVSADYFRLFGAAPARGRTFTAEDDRPGAALVVVIAHRLWATRYGAGDVIGKSMRLDGESYTIVGVMDAAFRADDYGTGVDLWLPLRLDPAVRTEGHFFAVAGRLRPNVTLAQAQERVRRSTEDFRREFPNAMSKGATFDLQPLREALIGNTRTVFFVLLVAVAFVLLIACSNLATLVLLQGSTRRREIAIRTAIGASRGRIVRQLLTENMLLSLVAGVLGLGLGWLAVRALVANISGLPRLLDSVTLDWRVVAFTTALSVMTALLFGLVPALRMSRADLGAATTAAARSSRGPERRRLEAGLVVLQVSLALVLLIGSGLLIRTVVALMRVETGFDPDHVLTMRTSLSGPDYSSAARVEALVRRGKESLGTIPGVAAVAASYGLPLADGGALPFEIVGRPLPDNRPYHGGAGWLAIAPGYFQVLRIPLMRGRDFTDDDSRHTAAVVIINEVLARQNWPDDSPIGKQLILGRGTGPQFADEPARAIVGVVGAVRAGRLETDPGPEVYVPQAQLPDVANAFVASRGQMAWLGTDHSSP